MSNLTISRGAAASAAALLLGGAFITGATLSGHEAKVADIADTADTSVTGVPHAAAGAGYSAVLATLPTTPAAPAPASPPASGGITVTGTARVAGTPDTLRLDLSVTGKGGSVTEALNRANAAASKVHKSLRRGGVAPKDLQTSTVQVQPEYTYPPNGSPTLKGYLAVEGVTAALRDLRTAGAAITAATAAGGNAVQVNNISLDLESTSKLAAAARAKAVADARTRAEQLAQAAGRRLGAVTSMTEVVSSAPPVDYSMRGAKVMDSSAVPIQPGSQDVAVSVTVSYAFG